MQQQEFIPVATDEATYETVDLPTRHRLKPLIVEAVRWTGESLVRFGGLESFGVEIDPTVAEASKARGIIHQGDGYAILHYGDYVLLDSDGKMLACSPGLFADIFEPYTGPENSTFQKRMIERYANKSFPNATAHGGIVITGKQFIVGEPGPEIIVPTPQAAPTDPMQDHARLINVGPSFPEERDRYKAYLRGLGDLWTQYYGPHRFGPRFADELHRRTVEAEGVLALGEQAVVDAFSRTLELSREGACRLAVSFGYSRSLGAWMQDHLIEQKVLVLNFGPYDDPVSTSPAPVRGEG